MTKVSKLMNDMYQQRMNNTTFYGEYDTKYFLKLTEMTKKWSEIYSYHSTYFKENIKEMYSFMNREYIKFGEMIESYYDYKKATINYKEVLNNKKEKNFKLGNVDTWDLSPEDIINKDSFLHNKEVCFQKMLRQETSILQAMETKTNYLNFQISKEYHKLKNYLSNLLLLQNTSMAEKNQTVLGDIFHMMKLITMNI